MKSMNIDVSTFVLGVLVACVAVRAESLTIRTGEADAVSARSIAAGTKTEAQGTVEKGQIVFPKLLAGERYDIAITTRAGPVLRLIDLSWYATLPANANAEPAPDPLSDDDRQAIQEILRDIKTFTNKNAFLHLIGDSTRAVGLVELIRDTDFHARQGDEIIWRIEVWYFENQAGGWAKVQQQNRVVERERFKSADAFEAHRKPFKWIGIEKGLMIERGKASIVELPSKK